MGRRKSFGGSGRLLTFDDVEVGSVSSYPYFIAVKPTSTTKKGKCETENSRSI